MRLIANCGTQLLTVRPMLSNVRKWPRWNGHHSHCSVRRSNPPAIPERHAPLHNKSLSHLPRKPIVIAPPWIKSDASKRARLLIADLRDATEPGRFRFETWSGQRQQLVINWISDAVNRSRKP
jgi:hypothetical protein